MCAHFSANNLGPNFHAGLGEGLIANLVAIFVTASLTRLDDILHALLIAVIHELLDARFHNLLFALLFARMDAEATGLAKHILGCLADALINTFASSGACQGL